MKDTVTERADVDAVTEAVLTASRLLVAVSARSIAVVDESITLSQFRVLVILSTTRRQKVASLAEALGVNPSTATRAVDRLVAAGMVNRQTNPESRRETVISLTSLGQRTVDEVTARRRAEIAEIVALMPAGQRRGLVHALTAFSEAGSRPAASVSPYDADDTDWR
jgi:DNA-binding MarR family transcriptional regulator